MTQYYECHVTFDAVDTCRARQDVEDLGWTFSCIDGDIVEGAGVKCYATRHFNFVRMKAPDVLSELLLTAETLATRYWVRRRKVEVVIYDNREQKGVPQ